MEKKNLVSLSSRVKMELKAGGVIGKRVEEVVKKLGRIPGDGVKESQFPTLALFIRAAAPSNIDTKGIKGFWRRKKVVVAAVGVLGFVFFLLVSYHVGVSRIIIWWKGLHPQDKKVQSIYIENNSKNFS